MDEAGLEERIDALYGAPREEFVARRDALVKQLRADGDRDAAERVRILRKPTLAAWAVDQAVRAHPEEVADLLAAADRARQAQRGAVGGGDAEALRQATAELRALVDQLTDAALAALSEAGSPREPHADEVRTTLQAAAVGDDDGREALRRGRLDRPLEAAGFGALGDVAGLAPAAPADRADADADDECRRQRQRLDELRRQARSLRSAHQRLDRRAQRAEQHAQRLAAEAQEAADEAARYRGEEQRAANELSSLEAEIAELEAD